MPGPGFRGVVRKDEVLPGPRHPAPGGVIPEPGADLVLEVGAIRGVVDLVDPVDKRAGVDDLELLLQEERPGRGDAASYWSERTTIQKDPFVGSPVMNSHIAAKPDRLKR